MRLLLVEDHAELARMLSAYLERHRFVIDLAPTLDIAKQAMCDGDFDLVLLDRTLPDGDGLDLIAYADRHNRPHRFLLLSALGDVDDKVAGLELGASDYVTKPFEPRELLARIRAALRQGPTRPREMRRFGPVTQDVESGAFFVDDEPILLRRAEALVLAALMVRAGALVSRETLELRVYGYDKIVNANSLESTISRLRKALSARTAAIRIHSARGVGYQLVGD